MSQRRTMGVKLKRFTEVSRPPAHNQVWMSSAFGIVAEPAMMRNVGRRLSILETVVSIDMPRGPPTKWTSSSLHEELVTRMT